MGNRGGGGLIHVSSQPHECLTYEYSNNVLI